MATTRAEIELARAEVAAARAALLNPAVRGQRPSGDVVTVRRPVSGRVLKVVKDSEGVVQAGDPLIELGNVRALKVEVEVISADAVKMARGTPVEFNTWGGEHPLEGQVRVVEPAGFTMDSICGKSGRGLAKRCVDAARKTLLLLSDDLERSGRWISIAWRRRTCGRSSAHDRNPADVSPKPLAGDYGSDSGAADWFWFAVL
ncbi:MAG TPA: HlyD family secretion protein [Bryobacteraceae bacterium]|nr:HlyD family secretion protein [Bryobacteraceae bacterium]